MKHLPTKLVIFQNADDQKANSCRRKNKRLVERTDRSKKKQHWNSKLQKNVLS
jgi:hypothetical protein